MQVERSISGGFISEREKGFCLVRNELYENHLLRRAIAPATALNQVDWLFNVKARLRLRRRIINFENKTQLLNIIQFLSLTRLHIFRFFLFLLPFFFRIKMYFARSLQIARSSLPR